MDGGLVSHMPSTDALDAGSFTSITPSALAAGSTHNYDPVDATTGESFSVVDVIRQATSASDSILTGLTATLGGDFIIIENLGTGLLTLAHESASSTAANRFTLPGAVSLPVPAGGAQMLTYDEATSRWRVTTSAPASSVSGVGTGTTNTLSKFTSSTAVGNSQITDDGTTVVIPGRATVGQLQLTPFVLGVLPAGTTEDWDPGAGWETTSNVHVQTDSAGSTLGGLLAPSTASTKEGRIVVLLNHGDGNASRGASPLILKHRSSGSILANRFCMPDLTDLELPYTGGALLAYDGQQWFCIATSNGGRSLRETIGDLWFKASFPAALSTGNNNDYEPTGWADYTLWQVTANTGAIITGLKYFGQSLQNEPYMNGNYQSGIVRIISNRNGAGTPIRVLSESTASSVANRISSASGDFEIPGGQTCIFVYDFSSARWRVATGLGSFSKLSLPNQTLATLGAGNNNNWNPTGFSSCGHWRVLVGAASVLTGMVAQETGAIRTLAAFGSFTIKSQDANSTAANQFYLPAAYQAGGLALAAGDTATFRYDGETAAWMCIGLGK